MEHIVLADTRFVRNVVVDWLILCWYNYANVFAGVHVAFNGAVVMCVTVFLCVYVCMSAL